MVIYPGPLEQIDPHDYVASQSPRYTWGPLPNAIAYAISVYTISGQQTYFLSYDASICITPLL